MGPSSERLNQVLLGLLVVIDCSLFENVDHPFIVRWRYLDVVVNQLLYFLFLDLVNLIAIRPCFLKGVLFFCVDRLDKLDIVIRNLTLTSWLYFLILEERLWLLDPHVRIHVW